MVRNTHNKYEVGKIVNNPMIEEETDDIIHGIYEAFVSFKRLYSFFFLRVEYSAPKSYDVLKLIKECLQLIKRQKSKNKNFT